MGGAEDRGEFVASQPLRGAGSSDGATAGVGRLAELADCERSCSSTFNYKQQEDVTHCAKKCSFGHPHGSQRSFLIQAADGSAFGLP